MLRSVVVIIFGMLSICIAFPAQITSYNDIPNNVEYDRSPLVKIGDNYYLIETAEKLNWFAAAHQCRKKGANLASIESKDEMQALNEYLGKYFPIGGSFWLSGNDLEKKKHFQWLSTGQSMEYTNWNDGEPNDSNGDENCVQLYTVEYDCKYKYENEDKYYYNSYIAFKFNDATCTFKTNYICEADNPKEISIATW